MPECDYCGASFDSEAAELRHLKSEHRDELGPIDRRRVGDVDEDDEGLPAGPIALGIVLLASAGIVAYVVFFAGGGAASQPVRDGTHEHGTINATIDGQAIDFTNASYTGQDNFFHIHPGSDEPLWHAHGSPITLKYALATFGIEVNDDGTVLRFQNERYRQDDSGTEIRITVNGETVEPGEYTVEGVGPEPAALEGEGDDIEVVVETE